ncbi:MAG: HflK protein, partial [Duodenibacillus sp.]|nr:HflK protein [Duodenibacillus sp.]
AVKAGQDRERQINEGQAYANAVVPAAKGLASRLVQEAEGYKARVVDTAAGDAERFGKVFAEYRKAPEVTRDRLYIDAMRDIYANTKKVFVESRSGSNLLYLPFEKLLSEAAKSAAPASAGQSAVEPAPAAASAPAPEADARTLMRMRGR